MKQKFLRIFIFGSFLLAFGLFGLRASVFPYLQRKAQAKAKVWLEKEGLQLQYDRIHIGWRGIRIENVRLERDNWKLKSNMDLQWHFVPDNRLVALDHIRFVRPRLLGYRNSFSTKSSELDFPESASLPTINDRFEAVLSRWIDMGMSLSVVKGEVQIYDSFNKPMLQVPEFDLEFNAESRSSRLRMLRPSFRQTQVLRSLDGQILFQPERENYPFIFQAQDPGGEPWQLQGQISQDFNHIEFRHKRVGLPETWLSQLSVFGEPEKLRFLISLSLDGLLKDDSISFDMRLASSNLMIKHDSLGPGTYGPWPLSVRIKGSLEPDTGLLQVGSGRAFLMTQKKGDPLRLEFEGSKNDLMASWKDHPLELAARVRSTSCQTVLDSLPANFLPLLKDFKLNGHFQAAAKIKLMSADGLFQLDDKYSHFGCSFQEVPEMLTREWLFNPDLEPAAEYGGPSMRALKSKHFVSRELIPDDFFKGVVAAEDSGFWNHNGFRLPSLIAAFQANLKAGQVLYGGSTITMQLVKNLYLQRDRVITRKLQELFLAWAIEQTLTKSEILEIYANVIEFAPQTYGISKGAHAYFGKAPQDLSSAEALFLASILPSPAKNFAESYCGGRIAKKLEKRMMQVASGLVSLSQEAEFMNVYQQDLHNLRFESNERHCENRISRSESPRGRQRM